MRKVKDFYLDIPPMADVPVLWNYLRRHNPTVLTGVPGIVPEAPRNKQAWVRRHLGPEVPVIACKSRDKCLHATAGAILIDDWEKYRDRWLAAGGVWITHRSAMETIDALRKLGL